MCIVLMSCAQSVGKISTVHFCQAFIVSDRGFSVRKCYALIQAESVMALANPLTEILGQNIDEHFAKVLMVEAAAKPVPLLHPIANVDVQVLDVTAWRESVERSDALQFTLVGTALMLNVKHPP